jgi:hypothetical protein
MALLGGVLSWPFIARAQQKAMPQIGWLSSGSRQSDEFRLAAFRLGLNESGYIEGQNVTIKCRWAQGQNDRLPALAADLVGRQSTAIAAVGPARLSPPKGPPRRSRSYSSSVSTRFGPALWPASTDQVATSRAPALW